jgi:copper chaperone
MKTVRLRITGMSCDHCVRAVESALRMHDGVRSATVDLGKGAAEVEYDEARVSPERLTSVIGDEGYEASIV